MNKYCVDCLHYRAAERGMDPERFARCAANELSTSLVLGTPHPSGRDFCDIQRTSVLQTSCGPSGRNWTALQRMA